MRVSNDDIDAMATAVISELGDVRTAGVGNVRGVVDSILGRTELGPMIGSDFGLSNRPSTIQGNINFGGSYTGIMDAGGWRSLSAQQRRDVPEAVRQAAYAAVKDRLAEVSVNGRVTFAPDFANPRQLGRASAATQHQVNELERTTNISGHLAVPAAGPHEYHVYGPRPETITQADRYGIKGPGIGITLDFDPDVRGIDALKENYSKESLAGYREGLAQPFDRDYSNFGQYGTPREGLSQPFASGISAPPEFSLQDLGDIRSPPAPDWSRDMTDRTQRGPVTDPYGFSTQAAGPALSPTGDFSAYTGDPATTGAAGAAAYPGITGFGANQFTSPEYSAPPDWGMERGQFGDRGPPGPFDFGDQTARSGIGLGVTGYGPGTVGTSAFPDIGPYDPLGAAKDAYGPSVLADPLSPSLTGAPQAFGNYGNQPIGYSPTGFSHTPAQPGMSLAALAGPGFHTGTGLERGITGYTETRTPTTIANPAYEAWQEAFNNPTKSVQSMYADDLADKLGQPTSMIGNVMNQSKASLASMAPSKTKAGPDKVTRSPVYGDVPVGHPISADLSQAGAGSWTSGLTNQANAINAQINDYSNYGLSGFGGTFGTGIGDPSGGMSLGGLGGSFSGGFSGALGGGYGPGGQPIGGSENQGGAGFSGGNFGGSQGSDPSGRGGLY